ncbi:MULTISPECIES: preprotein translocase subunit SecA [unclassified Rathayibacter]|uniref:preprotein translocase subunit SecA n=1 Tax=unclassified Rathayibacter TaxID=2609250 RepID=UPI0011B0AB3C|nr:MULTISPECIES: preprotein translocase subunit SecA [unclassified Rathayibacter]
MSAGRMPPQQPQIPRGLSGDDDYGDQVLRSADLMMAMLEDLRAQPSPVDSAEQQIAAQLQVLTEALKKHRPERVTELARLACLPWSLAGRVKPETEGGPAKAELLALLALVSSSTTTDGSAADERPNSLYEAAHEWAEQAEGLIYSVQALQILHAEASPGDPFATIAMSSRMREVWVRNTSYPDMVKTTHDLLFSDEPTRSEIMSLAGFDANDALNVLTALHDLQVAAFNERVRAREMVLREGAASGTRDPEADVVRRARIAHNDAWQPTADRVAFAPEAIAARAEVEESVAEAVLKQFAVSVHGVSARDVLEGFVGGDNPLRTSPVIRTDRGTFLIVHDALLQPAIRENFEQLLKSSPAAWEVYQNRRGDVLEETGRAALEKMLPGGTTYFGFDYFVPVNAQERSGPPAGYTKRVEGDLLIVVDDVAIVVEAKAVALTPAARAGETRLLRRSLVGIITKAAEQATRTQTRIAEDGGLRLHQGGWLDLSHIREIHTVALSLEDLSGVGIATHDLIDAGLLDATMTPWVVSIHDLQVIADVIDRPAEFLLYLRRRRDPEASRLYLAADELDLLLYFFQKGLYVEPDPTLKQLPHLRVREARTADVRRRARQQTLIITSLTDPLDAWHEAQIDPMKPRAPKPRRLGSPMNALADELQRRGGVGWLSLGATLISGSTKTQSDWTRLPKKLIDESTGKPRSWTAPFGTTPEDAWLLVWATLPEDANLAATTNDFQQYLKAKKYQLELRRGAVLLYDEVTRGLVDVMYDGTLPTPDPQMDEEVKRLLPIAKFASAPPPVRRGQRPQPKRKNRK